MRGEELPGFEEEVCAGKALTRMVPGQKFQLFMHQKMGVDWLHSGQLLAQRGFRALLAAPDGRPGP